jgi:hypothetical protein
MTVYELTKAPDDALTGWLTDGTVHPELQRKDGGTAPGQEKNTSAKLAPVFSGKSPAYGKISGS